MIVDFIPEAEVREKSYTFKINNHEKRRGNYLGGRKGLITRSGCGK